jgi:uncharacterized protein DUF4442
MGANTMEFIRLMKDPIRFRIFLFTKLPSAYFNGVRVREITPEKSIVSVPYKWFSRNPFRSTYFASLSMAAEMSTGALAMAHLYKHDPPVSMLVTKVESEYFKKATDRTWFECLDGEQLKQTIAKAVSTNEPQSFRAKSVGTNEQGEKVAEFYVTWGFKARTSKK